MAYNKIAYNKNQLLLALEKTLGIISVACKTCNISRKSFYNYLEADKEFAEKVRAIEETQADFVESQLLKAIKNDDTTAIIFYLKTKGRKRGYTERQELDLTTKGESLTPTVNFVINGVVKDGD